MPLDTAKPVHASACSRRSLAAGMAWAVPAVAAANVLPAFAASGNWPSGTGGPRYIGQAQYHWGTLTSTSDQQLQLYSRLQIGGIAYDSVESISFTYHVMQRTTDPLTGAPVPGAVALTKDPYQSSTTPTDTVTLGASGVNSPFPASLAQPIEVGDGTEWKTAWEVTLTSANLGPEFYRPIEQVTADAWTQQFNQTAGTERGYFFDTGAFVDPYSTAGFGGAIETWYRNQPAQNRAPSGDNTAVYVTFSYTLKNGESASFDFRLPYAYTAQSGYYTGPVKVYA